MFIIEFGSCDLLAIDKNISVFIDVKIRQTFQNIF